MKTNNPLKISKNLVNFYDYQPKISHMLTDVLAGLGQSQKSIPPKYFYNQQGSDLFQKITEVEEYYLTRTEIKILQEKNSAMADALPEQAIIVEYGCGSSEKIFYLLKSLSTTQTYLAIDISAEHLLEMTRELAKNFTDIEVIAVCADFTQSLHLPLTAQHLISPRVAFFPGSSIGNFSPQSAKDFLKNIRQSLGEKSHLLIGVDLKKDRAILEKAYNDHLGITAEFNKNILKRINQECGANFDLDQFYHRAFYNEPLSRIEMHLVSHCCQEVKIGSESFYFAKEESLHTENCYKYTIAEFQNLAKTAGWKAQQCWTDQDQLFSLHYFVAE